MDNTSDLSRELVKQISGKALRKIRIGLRAFCGKDWGEMVSQVDGDEYGATEGLVGLVLVGDALIDRDRLLVEIDAEILHLQGLREKLINWHV